MYDYTDRHAPKALQSFVAPCYRADQSLKAALKDVKNRYGSGPDEVIIIEVSSDE